MSMVHTSQLFQSSVYPTSNELSPAQTTSIPICRTWTNACKSLALCTGSLEGRFKELSLDASYIQEFIRHLVLQMGFIQSRC